MLNPEGWATWLGPAKDVIELIAAVRPERLEIVENVVSALDFGLDQVS